MAHFEAKKHGKTIESHKSNVKNNLTKSKLEKRGTFFGLPFGVQNFVNTLRPESPL